MLLKKIVLCTWFIAVTFYLSAQISKGDRYYGRSEYYKAINSYKKASRQDKSAERESAFIKLGNAYLKVNDYEGAESAYKKAIEVDGDVPAEVYYNYAQALKVNRKYNEAAEQYRKYIALEPGDKKAAEALTFCMEIQYYMTKPREYTISNVKALNTSQSEFAPYVYNGKLLYSAQRESFDFVNYPVTTQKGASFLNLYVADVNGDDAEKPYSLSKKVNQRFHDGPGCLSADGQQLYFTRVDRENKRSANHARIYTAIRDGKKWKNIKMLPIGMMGYSAAHPAISHNNELLFFSSDMPGGYGGKDIWMCTRKDSGWSQPVNLGPDVNTSGDEMFPSVRKDGMLFFSSTGLPGFGGLDIYSARELQGKWLLNRNEGLDINSSADDFGITFLNDTLGYFSSNRLGGKGQDDIYFYEFSSKSVVMEGTVLLTENPRDYAKNKKVILFDEKALAVDSVYTNNKGRFIFRNLDSEKRYMAVLAEEDPKLFGKARYFLAENDSVIHRVSVKQGNNRFVFKNLPIDPNGLPDMYTNDDLTFAGSLMSGNKGTVALKHAKLKLVNDFGDVVEETTTNEFGAFAFRNIPGDQNYMIAIEETDIALPAGTKITLTNKAGKEVKVFYKPAKGGKFVFKVLQGEKAVLQDMEVDDVSLVMGIYGYVYDQDKRPLSKVKIRLKDHDGKLVQEIETSELGKFNFKALSADKNYLFEADENDPSMHGVRRIYIADNKGRVYKVVDMVGGKFAFKILEVDKSTLGDFVVDDPWLKVVDRKLKAEKEKSGEVPVVKAPESESESELNLVIVENIYYGFGSFKLGPDGERVLNKAVEALSEYPKLVMEISSHTDSQSGSEFNLTLSRKRAQACVDYMVKKGISRSRLQSKGYGESRLLNHCKDGVKCSDEEHQINRRTEFKITKPTK